MTTITVAPDHHALSLTANTPSPHGRALIATLCFFLGMFGVHRFFVGKIGTGLLQIVTLGGLGLWAMFDLIIIVFGVFTDKQGRRVSEWF